MSQFIHTITGAGLNLDYVTMIYVAINHVGKYQVYARLIEDDYVLAEDKDEEVCKEWRDDLISMININRISKERNAKDRTKP